MPLPIEDYAVLGDTDTAALVGRDGSVDWLCLPRFDSPACFAALLGSRNNGRWLLGPTGPARTTRRYVGDSFVLETTHETPTGVVLVTDFMPVCDGRADLVRRVEGVSGTVRMRHEWVVRFGYGKVRPWVSRRRDAPEAGSGEMISAVAGPDMLVLRGSRLPVAADGRHEDEFDVAAGERLAFSTTWFNSHEPVPPPLDVGGRVHQTVGFWEDWIRRCDHSGPYREAVVRSLLVLRVLTHGSTGGIVAAPTTSLPERLGGPRNWDYRFCWLRDAALTLYAFLNAGYREEAASWRQWLIRAAAGRPDQLQIMYGVSGERWLPENEVPWLAGYEGSRPVRVGNKAAEQRQLDVYGELIDALQTAREAELQQLDEGWAFQKLLLAHVERVW